MQWSFGRLFLALECALLFFVAPPCLYFVRHELAFRVGPLVLSVAAVCAIYLARKGQLRSQKLWSLSNLRTKLRPVLLFFVPFALALTLLSAFFLRSYFLALPRQRPEMWGLMMVLYPLLAAIPQELVFRVFFFTRYSALFPNDAALVICNGVSFGLAHAFYGNWIALTLSTLGGVLFAYRYLRTRSLVTAGIEHGLWGDFLFTVGIGRYLYSGIIT